MVLIKIIKVMEIILSCMAIFILIFAVICLIFQFKPAVVVSGSMEPAIKTGSFFLIDKKNNDIKVGDVIAYKLQDMQVSHRVVAITDEGYITKGDNNDNVDFAPVAHENVIGTVMFAVPEVGYFFKWVTSIQGIIIVITLCTALFLAGLLTTGKEG